MENGKTDDIIKFLECNSAFTKQLDILSANAKQILDIQEIIKTISQPIKTMSNLSKNINEIQSQFNSMRNAFAQIEHITANLENIQKLISDAAFKNIAEINENLANIMKQKYLFGSEINYFKHANILKSTFDAIPKNFPTAISKLRIPTAAYLSKTDSFQFVVESKSFQYCSEGKNIDNLTVNDVNSIVALINSNEDGAMWTEEQTVELIMDYKKDKFNIVNAKSYKYLLNNIRKLAPLKEETTKEFFRGARKVKAKLFLENYMRNSEFGWPSQSRFNDTGVNFLYVSDKRHGVAQELLKHNKKKNFKIQLCCFFNNEKITVVDIESSKMDIVLKRQLCTRLENSTKTIKDEYIVSMLYANCIRQEAFAEGIRYKNDKTYVNFVFFNSNLFKYKHLGVFNVNDVIFA